MIISDGEVSDTDLRLWVASDKEKAEVGIAVNCLLTYLNHLGSGIITPYNDKIDYFVLQRLEKHPCHSC